jgi:hypothetical protein
LRIEREIVAAHTELGIKGERVPLSGAARYRGNGGDIDIYPFGPDGPPLCCQVKARASGEGFATLERWLGEFDALFPTCPSDRRPQYPKHRWGRRSDR